MGKENKTRKFRAVQLNPGSSKKTTLDFIQERPLLIRIQETPYSIVMRTPGEEEALAAGFCLGEGIVTRRDEIRSIAFRKDRDSETVNITLASGKGFNDLLKNRICIKHTGGGISRNQEIRHGHLETAAIKGMSFQVGLQVVFHLLKKLFQKQTHYQTTRGSHAALIVGQKGGVISFAEDVGRHNALDKAIGRAFLENKLHRACTLVLSSRISYEMVEKAARAGLPIVVSESRPTALAVETARALGMTLAFSSGEAELIVLCGENRIKEG